MDFMPDEGSRPVIFGEVLFDHYPDGSKHLGGAPFNVAWHLQAMGLRPMLVTRIGQDTEGELILTDMVKWGLDTQAVQIDSRHPTGRVSIMGEGSERAFEIDNNVAYDYISSGHVVELLKDLPCSMIYFGSLAQRSAASHKSLQRMLLESNLPAFVDVNLRKPWFDSDIINKSLDAARWLKLTDSELLKITASTDHTRPSLQQAAHKLRKLHDIETVVVTCEEKGSLLLSGNTFIDQTATALATCQDTVGAGDAFTAMVIAGLHKQWEPAEIMQQASDFAARICEHQGATPLAKSEYPSVA